MEMIIFRICLEEIKLALVKTKIQIIIAKKFAITNLTYEKIFL